MNKCHSWDCGSVKWEHLLHSMYLGQWHTFTVRIIFLDLHKLTDQPCSWNTISVLYNHWPVTIYSRSTVYIAWFLILINIDTDCWTNVLTGILVSCDANIYPTKCMYATDLYFVLRRCCLLFCRPLTDLFCTGDNLSFRNNHWHEMIYVGQWPIFSGPVILLYVL